MITNPILEEKYRVQRQLSEAAGYDLMKYEKNAQRMVGEVEKKYGIKFKYGSIDNEQGVRLEAEAGIGIAWTMPCPNLVTVASK